MTGIPSTHWIAEKRMGVCSKPDKEWLVSLMASRENDARQGLFWTCTRNHVTYNRRDVPTR